MGILLRPGVGRAFFATGAANMLEVAQEPLLGLVLDLQLAERLLVSALDEGIHGALGVVLLALDERLDFTALSLEL